MRMGIGMIMPVFRRAQALWHGSNDWIPACAGMTAEGGITDCGISPVRRINEDHTKTKGRRKGLCWIPPYKGKQIGQFFDRSCPLRHTRERGYPENRLHFGRMTN